MQIKCFSPLGAQMHGILEWDQCDFPNATRWVYLMLNNSSIVAALHTLLGHSRFYLITLFTVPIHEDQSAAITWRRLESADNWDWTMEAREVLFCLENFLPCLFLFTIKTNTKSQVFLLVRRNKLVCRYLPDTLHQSFMLQLGNKSSTFNMSPGILINSLEAK